MHLLETLLITSLYLAIEPLTTNLPLQPSNQFLIQTAYPSNPYLSDSEMKAW